MNTADIARLRLYNQQIVSTRLKKPEEVAAWLGGMQGQDYAGCKWSFGLRLPDATDADIEQAIACRTIIRTWPMRGTLHFVAAADVRWMLDLLAPRNIAGSARRHKQLELDEATFSRCRDIFIKALHGGRQLTRDDLYKLLEDAGISMNSQRGYHILWRSALDGIICFSAQRGRQQTFALLDEWAPGAVKLPRGEALAELAKRYFNSRGPATLQGAVVHPPCGRRQRTCGNSTSRRRTPGRRIASTRPRCFGGWENQSMMRSKGVCANGRDQYLSRCHLGTAPPPHVRHRILLPPLQADPPRTFFQASGRERSVP